MKDLIQQAIQQVSGELMKTCVVREYIQARILQSFQEDGVFARWAFLGGTALRFLYGIPRFSEDLDFSIVTAGTDTGFPSALERTRCAFEREGYEVTIALKDGKTVASAFIRIAGLLYELDLSPHAGKVLSIKVEVDTNPPAGAGLETSIVRRHVTLNLQHYDKSSLLSGKLHAILSRSWTKGRDLYDLVWYLADRSWPEPNIVLLNAALIQTGWSGPQVTRENWRSCVADRLESLDWNQARADVAPFLERERDIELVTLENASSLLGPGRGQV